MASKILMGDMPELMENFLNNLSNEIYSLYSCALVSRHWCKMTIPILWQDPFLLGRRPLFISKYFSSSLGEEEKFILKECGINAEFSKTLFDYARFLKSLNISHLVKKCFDLELVNSKANYMYHLINLLFKLFIESGATLHKLSLEFYEFPEFKSEIFYSLGENSQFFSRLQHLSLSLISGFNIENVATFLKALAKNTTKISALELEFYSHNKQYSFHALFHALKLIVKSQEKLRLFSLVGDGLPKEAYGFISTLECQKNSLHEVIMECCGYSAEFEVLNNCKNLETLRIWYCNMKMVKLLDYNKISTLDIAICPYDTKTLALILKKAGIFLQRLKFELATVEETIEKEKILLEALMSFCPNITYLNIMNFGFSTQLIDLIGNLQKLQFITLKCFFNCILEELKIRVIQFAEILPLTLQYLDLKDTLLDSYMDIFLNHCNVPLKKLLISCLDNEKTTKALIEFCIRKKSLNYLSLSVWDSKDNFRKEAEAYVTLVPYGSNIIVNC